MMCYLCEFFQASSANFRENMERIIGADDSKFSGADLAAIIRNKYGRSYDVQLIKKVLISFFLKLWDICIKFLIYTKNALLDGGTTLSLSLYLGIPSMQGGTLIWRMPGGGGVDTV